MFDGDLPDFPWNSVDSISVCILRAHNFAVIYLKRVITTHYSKKISIKSYFDELFHFYELFHRLNDIFGVF